MNFTILILGKVVAITRVTYAESPDIESRKIALPAWVSKSIWPPLSISQLIGIFLAVEGKKLKRATKVFNPWN